jgi:hypothetical protein
VSKRAAVTSRSTLSNVRSPIKEKLPVDQYFLPETGKATTPSTNELSAIGALAVVRNYQSPGKPQFRTTPTAWRGTAPKREAKKGLIGLGPNPVAGPAEK